MLLIGFLLFTIIALLDGTFFKKWKNTATDVILIISTAIAGFVGLFLVVGSLSYINNMGTLNNKLAFYQEDNKKIEDEVKEIIKEFKNINENLTIEEEDFNIILSKNASTLTDCVAISKQIDIYYENQKKIRELQEEKIDCDYLGWMLFFAPRAE